MSVGKIHQYEGNARGTILRVLAQYEGLDVEWVHCNAAAKDSAIGWDKYVEKFPYGKVQISIGIDSSLRGWRFQPIRSSPHCFLIKNKSQNKYNLLGKGVENEAKVAQWLSFFNMEYLPTAFKWFGPLKTGVGYNKTAAVEAEAKTELVVGIVEKHLATRTYLVGERISLADIMFASFTYRAAQFVFDAQWRKAHPNTTRHLLTLLNQPQYKAVVPKPDLIEVALKFTPAKKEAAPAKEKKEAAAAPKEKKEKPKKEAEEEDEPSVPAEPKAKHPCEALGGAASFPLDEWKRQYSNNETKDAMKWLDEHFDAKDYSLWEVVYKYPAELTQVYMSANLIGGLHTRLEASRKYLFGSAGVYGENNNSKIRGIYMLRGHEWKPVFEVGPDYESYEFRQIDLKKDRAAIEAAWAWTDEFEGLKFADGKVFK
ncbi:eEF1-gamma domain-containing protein [Atractiella rhizophila]|nr:eEF1-gamma domain-containing protein [Atractiella rhizophila]